jgi:uncharacterized GH25 family protein
MRNAPRRRPRAAAVLLLVLLVPVAAARAHDFYLIPGDSSPRPGATFDLAMHVSDVFPGQPTAWRTKSTREFFLRDTAGRLDLKADEVAGEPPKARVKLRSAGTAVIALVTDPSYIEIPADHFAEYLRHEGHEEIVRAREEAGAAGSPGLERYTRYVKTLVHGRGRSTDTALATLGLKIEIVPETQPATLRPGGRLPLRVLYEGKPYAGGYLCATHAGHSAEHDAYAWCGRLDAEGRAAVPIRASGWQIVRITRMIPRSGDPKAQWESSWAALTFEVPGKPSPSGGGAR